MATALALRPTPWPDRLTVRFLDVGQGDATLIQHPDGTAVLFDGGPPEARTVRLLREAGVERLAVVVATHASRDHHGGLLEVLERTPVELLVDGGDGARDRSFRAVLAAARDRGARIVRAAAPLELHAGGVTIRVLSPPPRPPGPAPEDPNPRAVVAVVSSGAFDLLLSADAESDTLGPLPLPDVEAMKVPHHGSADPGAAGGARASPARGRRDRGGRERLRPSGAVDPPRAARGGRPDLAHRPSGHGDGHRRGATVCASPPSGSLASVADFKPVYLVHGDDDAKIDSWRTRVRGRAEQERGRAASSCSTPASTRRRRLPPSSRR